MMSNDVRCAVYRLYPNKEQERRMLHSLDVTRNVYNALVNTCQIYIGFRLPFPSFIDLNRMVTKIRQENEWMQDVHSHLFTSVAKRVYNAFTAWMKRRKEGVGFPRFKSKNMFDSFTYICDEDYSFVDKDGHKGEYDRIRLGMIGLVKFSNPFRIKGKCKTATVFRRRIGGHYEWSVSIAYEMEYPFKDAFFVEEFRRPDVGIDLGLRTLATLSDGVMISNDCSYRKMEKKLAKANRKLSKCEKGSPERKRQLGKLSHLYKRIRGYRTDRFHKITREISLHYNNVYMEDLSVKNMMEDSKKSMRKSYRDASWGTFTRLLNYKVEETGNSVTYVNPAYTSQICSCCGEMVPKDLTIRMHICPHCGLVMSRDQNAAINILNRGLGLQTVTGQV